MPNESLVLEWLDENRFRRFPFTQDSNLGVLTDNVVLDGYLQYDTIPADAQLTSLNITGVTATFTFTSGVTFVATTTDPYPQYIRNANGLLVLGEDLATITSGSHTFTNAYLEPVVVYEKWGGVASVQFNAETPLTGDITFIEGYQFGLNPSTNMITMYAGRNYGLPIDCSFDHDIVDDCSDLISRINGVYSDGNGRILFNQGNGIAIITDPTNHRIFIGYNFNPDQVCPPYPVTPELGTSETAYVLDKTLHSNANTQQCAT